MKIHLFINKEATEEVFCTKHQEWSFISNEMNCCEREKENQLHIDLEK